MEHRWGRRQATDVGVRFAARGRENRNRPAAEHHTSGAYMVTKMNLRVIDAYLPVTVASRSAKIRVNGMLPMWCAWMLRVWARVVRTGGRRMSTRHDWRY